MAKNKTIRDVKHLLDDIGGSTVPATVGGRGTGSSSTDGGTNDNQSNKSSSDETSVQDNETKSEAPTAKSESKPSLRRADSVASEDADDTMDRFYVRNSNRKSVAQYVSSEIDELIELVSSRRDMNKSDLVENILRDHFNQHADYYRSWYEQVLKQERKSPFK